MTTHGPLAQGAFIGILGGGQLGKMDAEAAAELGYDTLVWAPPGDNPAEQAATSMLTAAYDDPDALDAFLSAVDAATLEFENVPVALVEQIESRGTAMRPSSGILRIAQDRWEEKRYFDRIGIPATKTRLINKMSAYTSHRDFAFPAILKTCRLGYDGKSQAIVRSGPEVEAKWLEWGQVPCVLEAIVDLASELSVIVARGVDGTVAAYPPVQNEHRGGILRVSRYPAAGVPHETLAEASRIAIRIALAEDFAGLLAVELFVTKDGALLANEIAPRPHNSGHGTIEGADASQFEQHIRAVAGLPLKDVSTMRPWEMHNLIGDEPEDPIPAERILSRTVHDYGKEGVKPGRKMGHVTYLTR